jgi:hypothetical protein
MVSTCTDRDSCWGLLNKAMTKYLCIIHQELLTATCFPDNPSHDQVVSDMWNGISKCLELYYARPCRQDICRCVPSRLDILMSYSRKEPAGSCLGL